MTASRSSAALAAAPFASPVVSRWVLRRDGAQRLHDRGELLAHLLAHDARDLLLLAGLPLGASLALLLPLGRSLAFAALRLLASLALLLLLARVRRLLPLPLVLAFACSVHPCSLSSRLLRASLPADVAALRSRHARWLLGPLRSARAMMR